jgi:lysozyme family protein
MSAPGRDTAPDAAPDAAFDRAFDRLMGHEGGYTPGVGDPGGETNWGICKRSYPHLDIKSLTREQAKAVYRRDFWDPLGAYTHPAITYQVFDFAVNSGISTAVRKLQAAIGVADDGHFGPLSKSALGKMAVPVVLCNFLAQRLRFWASLSTWDRFGKGWALRAATDLEFAAKDL